MHRHGRFHHGPPPFRHHRGGLFRGLFWLLPVVLFFVCGSGHFLPGILILVGIAVIAGVFLRGVSSAEQPDSPPPFSPPPFAPPPPRYDVPPIHRADLLPTHCSSCGAPVISSEVRWTGTQSAACSYCGSNLPMKK